MFFIEASFEECNTSYEVYQELRTGGFLRKVAVVRIPRLVLASKSVPFCKVTPCSNVLLPYSE
jgi:hypothetical protein